MRLTNHFVDGTEAQLGHDFTQAFSHVLEEGHNIFYAAVETLTQGLVLGRDTYWASVLVTLTHHDTTFNHQGCGCDAPLFST